MDTSALQYELGPPRSRSLDDCTRARTYVCLSYRSCGPPPISSRRCRFSFSFFFVTFFLAGRSPSPPLVLPSFGSAACKIVETYLLRGRNRRRIPRRVRKRIVVRIAREKVNMLFVPRENKRSNASTSLNSHRRLPRFGSCRT